MFRNYCRFLSLILVLSWFQCGLSIDQIRPVIGIVLETTERLDPSSDYSCPGQYAVMTDYKSFMEQSGASTVPVFVNQSDSYYEQLIPKLNGVIFPGGGVSITTSPYAKVAYTIYKMARKMNDDGNYFPVLGICLGMQELTTWPLVPRENVLSNTSGTEGISLPLNFTKEFSKSKLYKNLPDNLQRYMSQESITPNFHHYGLLTKTYQSNKQLTDFYMVTSTNYDGNGVEFVSTIEARNYPFYGLQWHPEKIAYFYTPNQVEINHSEHAVLVAQYISNFFISEAKKSKHKFNSVSEMARFMFNNYQSFFNQKTFSEWYCLNDTDVPAFDP